MSEDLNPRLSAGVAEAEFAPAPEIPAPAEPLPPAKLRALMDEGLRHHKAGDVKAAMDAYRTVLLHDRGNKEALYYTALALSQGNHDEAKVLAIMEHAVKSQPNVPEGHYNLGILYHRLGREEEAKARFLRAIALLPSLTEAKMSLAGAYLNLGEPEKGRQWLEAAAASTHEAPDSVYSRAFARLTLGRLMDGWADYDKRWRTPAFLVENRRDFGAARHWNGGPVPGRTLYVHTEQGAGDVVMASRFLPEVRRRSRCGRLIFEVGEALVPLFEANKAALCVDDVIASNTPTPARVHNYLPMMGIFRKAGLLRYPARVAGAEGWLEPTDYPVVHHDPARLNVGVAWAGSRHHKNDRYRSILWPQFRDELLAPLAGKVKFHSFQVGERARDADDATEGLVHDLTPLLTDYNKTAGAAAQMDLMVCVDTATVHVAGALKDGPPVIALIPAAPDWRWGLEGSATPWYDRVGLIRQARCDDWQSPLRAARAAVEAIIGARGEG